MKVSAVAAGGLLDSLEISFPLIQSGMGGVAGPELAAAVSESGCAGVVALYKDDGSNISAKVRETASLTRRPFGVNLIPEIVSEATLLNVQVPAVLNASDDRVFFTFFGLPPESVSLLLRSAGRKFLVMVGDPGEIPRAIDAGACAVILQGNEAGGHLLGSRYLSEMLSGFDPASFPVPILVSGGIVTGSQMAAYVRHGFQGALCGSMFVACRESRAHDLYKEKIAGNRDTLISDEFEFGWPGRKHRVLRNPVVGLRAKKVFIAKMRVGGKEYPVPRYSSVVPLKDTHGKIEEMVMYAGSSCAYIRKDRSVAEILSEFVEEFNLALTADPEERIHGPAIN